MSWPLVKLNDICRPRQWKTLSKSSLSDSGYPVYGAGGKIGFHSKFNHEFPTLMIACRGTCGEVSISEPNSYINGNMMALDELDSSRVDIRYLYRYLARRGFEDVISGAVQQQITGRGLAKVEIPLPSLPEQKRIVAILDKADAIRRKRQQAIQLADDFLRAVFLDMFGDPVTNPRGWEVKTLASTTKDWRGGASIKPDDFTDIGFPVLHKGAINHHGRIVLDDSKKTFVSNQFAEAKKSSLVGRDCVAITLRDLVPSGPSIGLMADLSDYEVDKYLLSQGAYGFSVKPKELHAGYLVALSNHDGFRRKFKKISVGSTQIHIRSSDLKELTFPVPPIELQLRYSVIRRAVIDFQRKAAAGVVEGLLPSLSQKAFSGQL
ncbi:restriction endonuclease subunit S [Stenotrophomonas maltophilia]|uniref:restriction endonuclease subunit S n=1 Tax=Stenotrophomonas maltophilia TaxID=40324 RepID=UPI0013103E44